MTSAIKRRVPLSRGVSFRQRMLQTTFREWRVYDEISELREKLRGLHVLLHRCQKAATYKAAKRTRNYRYNILRKIIGYLLIALSAYWIIPKIWIVTLILVLVGFIHAVIGFLNR